MSILYSNVEDSEHLRKATSYGAKEFVHVTVNPKSADQFPFPLDFTFPPCFLPKKYLRLHDRIQNFKVRPDDVWVLSFPKSGTTWTMNIVMQLMNNIDLSTEFFDERQRSMEISMGVDEYEENSNNEAYRTFLANMDKIMDKRDAEPSPRLMKSHFPAHLLPKDIWTVKPKLIHVHRDAKDVALSLFHMLRNSVHFKHSSTMEESLECFLNGYTMYGPFYKHVDSFQQLNELDHLLLLNYEEMLENPFAAVKRMSEFLNYSYNDNQLNQLTKHVSFQNMRNQNTVDRILFPNGFK